MKTYLHENFYGARLKHLLTSLGAGSYLCLNLLLGSLTAQAQSDSAGIGASVSESTRLVQAYQQRVSTILDKANAGEKVRIIVQLRTFTRPDALLVDDEARSSQQLAIAEQQTAVLDRFFAKHSEEGKSVVRFQTLPFLALDVTEAEINSLLSDPGVIAIEEDREEQPQLYESGPLIGANKAYNAGFYGKGQAVAIIDSGVISDHPFLQGKVISEACFSTPSSPPGARISLCPGGETESQAPYSARDCPSWVQGCGHGTHVAGIAAGNRLNTAFGQIAGIAAGADIVALKVSHLDNAHGGISSVLVSDEIKALERAYWLKKNGTRIAAINISLTGTVYPDTVTCDSANAARKQIIDSLRALGVATVAASGNNGTGNGLAEPACISSVISVGAVTKRDEIPAYSNSAHFLKLLAPGGNGDLPNDTNQIFSSTGFAPSMSAGNPTMCALRANGSVYCWGGSAWNDPFPNTLFSQVASGKSNHFCGIRASYDPAIQGTVVCWGWNGNGEGTPPPNMTFRQISAGDEFTCGIRSDINPTIDGSVVCWGLDKAGRTRPPAGQFAQISAGDEHVCGVLRTGSLACWGNTDYNATTPPPGGFRQVSSSSQLSCATQYDGLVICWGLTTFGSGIYPDDNAYTEVSVGYGMGGHHACGLRTDGEVRCHGNTSDGQDGVESLNGIQVSAGYEYTCITLSDGKIRCAGQVSDPYVYAPPLPLTYFDPWYGFGFSAGTSMASPHVAGAWAVLKAIEPEASVDEIYEVLRKTGKPILDTSNGVITPRIDLFAAIGAMDTYALTVMVEGEGGGIVTSVPAGIECGTDCSDDFAKGSTVTLTARTANDSIFTGWGGACSGNALTCAVTMDSAKNVIATFSRGFPLIITKAGTGTGTVRGVGIDCGTICTNNFASGAVVTLTATADASSTFSGWGGDSQACQGLGDCTLVMNSAKRVTATFTLANAQLPDLVLTSVTGPTSGLTGDKVKVSAMVKNQGAESANPYWVEFYLSDDNRIELTDIRMGYGCDLPRLPAGNEYECGGTIGVPQNVQPGTYYLGAYVDSHQTVTESNEANNGRSTVNAITIVAGTGDKYWLKVTRPTTGLITSTPEGIFCGGPNKDCQGEFSSVSLLATPITGYFFKNWVGCPGSTGPTCTLALSATTTVKAIFAKLPKYTLKITKTPLGAITSEPQRLICRNKAKSCSAKFYAGTRITLLPVPQPGRSFMGWGGACTGDDLCVLEMDGNKLVSATFQ